MHETEQLKHHVSRKIGRNTAFNILGGALRTVAIIILTPYIIKHIGVERYGIWAIASVLTGCLGLFDFGIGTSFVKYIAEFYYKKDFASIDHVVNTGLACCLILTAVILPAGNYALNPLTNLLNIPFHLHGETMAVFFLGIILFCINIIFSCFKSIQAGLQRMDITNKVSIVMSLVLIIGTIYFLENGYGLRGLIINSVLVGMVSGVIDVAVAFNILPQLRLNFFLFNREIFEKLFNFGYKMQVAKIATLIHLQIDKFLLAHFLNISIVAYYEVPANLSSRIRDVPLVLLSAIFPAVSGLDIHTNRQLLHKIYLRSMKYVILAGFPLMTLAIFLAKPFISLWLGEGYEKSVLTLQLLLVGYITNIMTGPGFIILNGIGKPNYGVKSSVIAAILNLIMSIILIQKIGFFGAVWGTICSMIIAAVYFIFMFHRVVKLSIFETMYKITFKPIIACSISYIISCLLFKREEYSNWGAVFGGGALFLTVFIGSILGLKYIDDFDKELLAKYTYGMLSLTTGKKK